MGQLLSTMEMSREGDELVLLSLLLDVPDLLRDLLQVAFEV